MILDADPLVVAERLRSKGAHNRLQRLPSSSQIEWHHYRQTCQRLADAGWIVHCIDCTATTVTEVARSIHGRLRDLKATATRESSSQP